MSRTLLSLVKSFQFERLTAEEFVNAYMELWRFEGSNNILQKDPDNISECLSSTFCLADLYNPELNRETYELNEKQLRSQINELLDKLGL